MAIGVGSAENDYDNDNDFIYFVKYFQQIRKSANKNVLGQNYIILLRYMDSIVDPINVTVYGHSLEKTDADVISSFIKLAQKVTIYYYNDDDHEKNL